MGLGFSPPPPVCNLSTENSLVKAFFMNWIFLSRYVYPSVNFNWTVDGGTGNIYPNGPNCLAYAYPFVRVRVQAQNTCGLGTAYVFYLLNAAGSYSINSPNPMEETLSIAFSDPEVVTNYLETIELSSTEQPALLSFDKRKAGLDTYFDKANRLAHLQKSHTIAQ